MYLQLTTCFPHSFPLTYFCTAVDLQTQAPQQNEQQDSESGCMC